MNRKKTIAILPILMIAALVVPMVFAPKPAKAGPARKATGEIWFDQPTPATPAIGTAYIMFNAHEAKGDRPNKGEVYYSDDAGYYLMEVSDFSIIDENTAYFAGFVVESTHASVPVGWIVRITVFDGGTPGTNGDLLNGNVNDDGVGLPIIPVIAGNLVVTHKK